MCALIPEAVSFHKALSWLLVLLTCCVNESCRSKGIIRENASPVLVQSTQHGSRFLTAVSLSTHPHIIQLFIPDT